MKAMMTILAAALMTAGASAQDAENGSCPISGKTVASTAPTSSHEGHTIGFCCGGCQGTFDAWSEQRKDGFVLTFASQPTGEAEAEDFKGDAYVLATCPISGKALGTTEVKKTINGREVRFCCGGCVEPFNASKEQQAKLDKAMIQDQTPYYPMTTCPISGEPLMEEGKFIGVNAIYKNRLVRFCCTDCQKEFEKDPAPVIAKLNAAVVRAQREAYPIKTCPISDGELGSMGDPTEIVVANRLVRFCCGKCESRLIENPTAFIATLDAAWKANGMPWAEGDAKDPKTTTVGGD